MASVIAKNEVTASKRRCDLIVLADGGTLAPRGTDFAALGILYVCTGSSPHYAAATGSCTNKRKPLVVADDVIEAVDTGTNETLQLTGHVFETGDGPVRFTTTGTLPGGLSAGVDYWLIKFDANKVSVATSLANAYAGTKIDLTSSGTGTNTLDVTASTQRGLDGRFTYEFTQTEVNVDVSELSVLIEGSGYAFVNGGGAYTTVNVASSFLGLDAVLDDGKTGADLIRGIARTSMAKFTKSGNTYTFRDLADTKNSHHGDVTTSGRVSAVYDDLT